MYMFTLWLFYILLEIKKIESWYYPKSFEVKKTWKLIMLAYIDGKTTFSASCIRFIASYWFATTARMQILAVVSEVTLTIF